MRFKLRELKTMNISRKEFVLGAAAATVMPVMADVAKTSPFDLKAFQAAIDKYPASEYVEYLKADTAAVKASLVSKPNVVVDKLESAFDEILEGVKTTAVTDRPAVWMLYNMGIVVKTREACFGIDIVHRRAKELAPYFDFMLITHNHGDHCNEELYAAMNKSGKTVISNFKDNYGVKNWKRDGGFTRAKKTFKIKDVEVSTMLVDHNDYLIDYTTAFEIKVGDFTLVHSGDCFSVDKINPACANPDIWVVHPCCGIKTEEGGKKLNPKLTAICHVCELGHKGWRVPWELGYKVKGWVEAAGYKAAVPMWGERIDNII